MLEFLQDLNENILPSNLHARYRKLLEDVSSVFEDDEDTPRENIENNLSTDNTNISRYDNENSEDSIDHSFTSNSLEIRSDHSTQKNDLGSFTNETFESMDLYNEVELSSIYEPVVFGTYMIIHWNFGSIIYSYDNQFSI